MSGLGTRPPLCAIPCLSHATQPRSACCAPALRLLWQGMKGDTAKKRRRRLGAAGELSDEEAGELGELPAAERSSDEEEVGERLGGCTWG